MTRKILEPFGTRESLETYFFDAFLTVSDVFAVGVNFSAPGFQSGSATLFSGDDDYYGAITEPFPAENLQRLAMTAEAALARLDTIAPMRGDGRNARRGLQSRYAGSTLPSTAPEQMRLHPGLLAVGETMAAVVQSRKDCDPLLHLYTRIDKRMPWNLLWSCDSYWFPAVVECLHDAARTAVPVTNAAVGSR